MIRSGRPQRSRLAVQDNAVTTCSSRHRATSSRATVSAGSLFPLVMRGTLCPIGIAIGTPLLHKTPDERALSFGDLVRGRLHNNQAWQREKGEGKGAITPLNHAKALLDNAASDMFGL